MNRSPDSPALLAVYTTLDDEGAAQAMARDLVERRLAACAQVERIQSVYRWQGAVPDGTEYRVLFKTTGAAYAALEAAILAMHPYDLPAIHAVAADRVHAPYADWVAASTVAPPQEAPPASGPSAASAAALPSAGAAAPEIRTLDSREVYRNRWMRVREDRIVRASGAEGIFGVVEKPDFAVVVPLQDGMLHLVEQYRYPVGARYWEFPQGSSDRDSVRATALAAAELREETGLVAASITHVGRLFPSYGYATQAFDIYLATGLHRGDSALEPEEEGLVSRAFAVADVERMVRDGRICDGPTVAAFGLLRLRGLL